MRFLASEVDVTPGSAGSWVDVDVSAHIPSGSTGASLRIVNLSTSTDHLIGVRKKGSTDDRKNAALQATYANQYQMWPDIGVDGSRIFQAWVGNTTDVKIYLLGYYGAEAVFFTNAIDVSTGTTGSFVDTDITAHTGGGALLAFLEILTTAATSQTIALRQNGSSDNRAFGVNGHAFARIGVDAGEIFEQNISSTSVDVFLIGYMTAGVVWLLNASALTDAVTNYADIPAHSSAINNASRLMPGAALGGLYEVTGTTNSHDFALRKNGSSDDYYYGPGRHNWAVAAADASGLVEMKMSNSALNAYLQGVFFDLDYPYIVGIDEVGDVSTG